MAINKFNARHGLSVGANAVTIIESNGNLTIPGTANIVGSITTSGAITGANLSVTGNVSAVNLSGTLTTGNQPNITNIGTLGNLSVTGNISGRLTTGNQPNITNIGTLGNLSVTGNISGLLTTGNQPNITNIGTLGNLSVTGNVGAANITGTHYGSGTNLSGLTGANINGQVGNALVAGTVYTAAQPNITSVGNLTSLTVNGPSSISNRNTQNSAPFDLFSYAETNNSYRFVGGTNQIFNIGIIAASTLAGKYFRIYTAAGTFTNPDVTGGQRSVDIWFTVNGVGTQPVTDANSYVRVDLESSASAGSVAASIQSAVMGEIVFNIAERTGSAIDVFFFDQNTLVFKNKIPGNYSAPEMRTSGFSFAIRTAGQGIATRSTIDSVTNSVTGYGVLAPNGKIYYHPNFPSTNVLVFDPVTEKTYTVATSITESINGAVLAPNGKIYCVPSNSSSILVIDTTKDTTYLIGSFSGLNKWYGGVLARNGKIYCIPRNSATVLEIDPTTDTTLTFGALGSGTADKWIGGVITNTGIIYGIPYGASTMLKINPYTLSVQTVGAVSAGTGGNSTTKWVGGVYAPNGKIYAMPNNSNAILVHDPETDITSIIDGVNGTYYGSTVGADGKIYAAPYGADSIMVFDPSNETYSFIGSFPGTQKWTNGVLAHNGKIYFAPGRSNSILSIHTGGYSIPTWYLSAYHNKF